MATTLTKALALASLASGFKVSENPINRYLELMHLRMLLRSLEINCVLDVGANRGQFAGELRRIGYRGKIVSFEPVRSEFSILGETFKDDREWQGYPVALGAENKTADINVFQNLTVLSSILRPRSTAPNIEMQTVDVKRLDGLLPQILSGIDRPKVFLKMDTQGYDLEVFAGAGACVQDILGLQSELSVKPLYHDMPHYLDALSTYEDAGFELVNLTVVARESDNSLQELNCFMRRSRH